MHEDNGINYKEIRAKHSSLDSDKKRIMVYGDISISTVVHVSIAKRPTEEENTERS